MSPAMLKMMLGQGMTSFLYMAPARISLAVNYIIESVKYNIAYCSMDTQFDILLILLEFGAGWTTGNQSTNKIEAGTLRCDAANPLA